MKAIACLLLAVIASAAALYSGLSSNADSPPAAPPGLPGARPVIDASQYPTLQAAFDALPPTGGTVQLPAGEFVIDQPLFVRAGDASIEGAGTATHIKNVNEDGQPALVLEHPDGAKDRKTELWRMNGSKARKTSPRNSRNASQRKVFQKMRQVGRKPA